MSAPLSTSKSLALLRDFSDWQSPMVVKELRHGMRTRFFTGALLVLHGLLALLMLSALGGVTQEIVTNTFWVITFILLLGVMPLRGFAVLSSEMRDGTLDMLTLTSISSFRIVYGKWAALFGQTLLVASSLLPYMVARYQLGGVEIPREAVALGLLVLMSALSTAAVVGFSSQKSILLRLFLLTGVGIVTLLFASMMMSALIEQLGDQMLRGFLDLQLWEQTSLAAGMLLVTVYGVYVFLSLGASRIAPASENHSTRKRIVALGVMGLLAVVGCGLATLHADEDAAVWAWVPALILTIVIGVDVMTEEMPRFPTVVAPLAKRGWLGRLLGRFLYPGWASGVILYITLCASPLAIVGCMWRRSLIGSPWSDPFIAYLLCILMANLVPVCLRFRQKNRFAHWWVVQIMLLALGVLILFLVEVTGTKGIAMFGLGTPGTALLAIGSSWSSRFDYAQSGTMIGMVWTITALCLAVWEMRIYAALESNAATLPPSHTPPPHEPA